MRTKTFRQWDMLLNCIRKFFFFFLQEAKLLFDWNALGQLCLEAGLWTHYLLAMQICQSQFSPWFQSDMAASHCILVGLGWL